jgi:hypothetical protein
MGGQKMSKVSEKLPEPSPTNPAVAAEIREIRARFPERAKLWSMRFQKQQEILERIYRVGNAPTTEDDSVPQTDEELRQQLADARARMAEMAAAAKKHKKK